MSIAQCQLFDRGSMLRRTRPVSSEEFRRIARLGEEGAIRILSIHQHGNAEWIVHYYGPEIQIQQQPEKKEQTPLPPLQS